jgi:hypothetical protein
VIALAGTVDVGRGVLNALNVARSPLTQLEWEIHPTEGDDAATGAPGDPLQTYAELFRILDRFLITQTTTVTLLASTAEDVVARAWFSGNGLLRLVSTTAVLFSGTLTAGTLAWDDDTQQEVVVACSGLPTSWTASGLIGKMIRIVDGPRAGNWTFVSRDLGSRLARCAGWSTPNFDLGTAQSGDAFEVLDFVHASGLWTVYTSGRGRLRAQNIELGTRQAHAVDVFGSIELVQSVANGCDAQAGGDIYAFGSYLGHGPKALGGGSYTIDRAASVRASGSPWEIGEGGRAYVYDQCIVDGYSLDVFSGPGLRVEGSLSICNATEAVIALPGARIHQPGHLWMRDTVTRLAHVYSNAAWSYGVGREPVHVGTTTPDIGLLGGDEIVGFPQVNADKLASIVEIE